MYAPHLGCATPEELFNEIQARVGIKYRAEEVEDPPEPNLTAVSVRAFTRRNFAPKSRPKNKSHYVCTNSSSISCAVRA
jgi:hypothetical protein